MLCVSGRHSVTLWMTSEEHADYTANARAKPGRRGLRSGAGGTHSTIYRPGRSRAPNQHVGGESAALFQSGTPTDVRIQSRGGDSFVPRGSAGRSELRDVLL